MTLVNELIVTVVGGVVTALVLSLFRRGGRQSASSTASGGREQVPASRRGSAIGQFFHMAFAVMGGIGFALFGGRWLFQSGILERSMPMRLGLLFAGTLFCWLVLLSFRRKGSGG